jgi:tetratricopeptide (TPR) repeat protein
MTALPVALMLAGNLATGTVRVEARWWAPLVWVVTGLLVVGSGWIEVIRNQSDADIYLVGKGDVQAAKRLRIGTVPALASGFCSRAGTRSQIDRSWMEASPVVLVGGAGMGKSQLAAYYARQAIRSGVGLVVWVDAARHATVMAVYAEAAQGMGLAAARDNVGANAAAFLAWIATTDQSWLIVLDDITDLDGFGSWWPTSHTGTGQVLATTRRREAMFSGGGRSVVEVGVYADHESVAYLYERLVGSGNADLFDREAAAALGVQLGLLPLAVSHAAAYMINEGLTCRQYLSLFTAERLRLADVLPVTSDADHYGRPAAVALLLSLDAAQAAAPVGLAVPALRLAALLDPAGHPDSVWSSPAVLTYLAARHVSNRRRWPRRRGAVGQVSASQTRATLRLLHRYGLITHDPHDTTRGVRIHALTARAARETFSAAQLSISVLVGADALLHIWPEPGDAFHDLATAIRSNVDVLRAHAKDLLWRPTMHPVLDKAGTYLVDFGPHAAAALYWRELADTAQRLFGLRHRATAHCHTQLGMSYRQSGRINDAVAVLEQVVTNAEGSAVDDPDSLRAKQALALCYPEVARVDDAITLLLETIPGLQRRYGVKERQVLAAQCLLGSCYRLAGRYDQAVTLLETVANDCHRLLGDADHGTADADRELGIVYRDVGRLDDATRCLQGAITAFKGLYGTWSVEGSEAMGVLALGYRDAGRIHEAIELLDQAVDIDKRMQATNSPESLVRQVNLAGLHAMAGTPQAIERLEAARDTSRQVLGPIHANTISARIYLTSAYARIGRPDAIEQLEATCADARQILGENRVLTQRAESNLAQAYAQAGRLAEAITLQEGVVRRSQQHLGASHPYTVAANESLEQWKQ